MDDDDAPLDQPFVRAIAVPGSVPDTEAVDVLIVWDDLAEIEEVARKLLAGGIGGAILDAKFGGEVRITLPGEFIPDDKSTRKQLAAMEARLQGQAAKTKIASGGKVSVKIFRA